MKLWKRFTKAQKNSVPGAGKVIPVAMPYRLIGYWMDGRQRGSMLEKFIVRSFKSGYSKKVLSQAASARS
jgi:hypothetical protein